MSSEQIKHSEMNTFQQPKYMKQHHLQHFNICEGSNVHVNNTWTSHGIISVDGRYYCRQTIHITSIRGIMSMVRMSTKYICSFHLN